ncbi:MAG: molybdopterin-dependent oxidoreductase, partial [Syntrophales bacterium]|nr:molybdopterin-dependent oxidoreductase [Syntrophales bacterium]
MDLFPMDVCCALLSRKTGFPVKIILSRQEEFESTRVRHPIIVHLKTGVKKDGTILAKEARTVLDGGAYGAVGVPAAFLSTLFLSLPYKVPNIKMEAVRIYTNKVTAGAMRGYTSPQIHFADDSHMDMIAEELGIDPIEIRQRNAITPGYETASGLKVTSCALSETIERASKSVGWKDKHGKFSEEGKGVGMGCSGFLSGTGYALSGTPVNYTSSAIIKLHTEGFATLYTGASDIGQGSDTVLSMIAAEGLGIDFDKVKIVAADTEITPFDAGSYGSRVTFQAGNAVLSACADAKRQLIESVAKKMEANPEDLESKGGRIYAVDSPNIGMSFQDAIWAYQEDNGGQEVVGRGVFRHEIDPSVYTTGRGNYSPAYSFSTGTAEVKVDKETGKVEVLKFTFAHDVGKAINPNNVKGQIEGSICMGLGYGLFEELLVEKGGILNPTFLDYKIPTALDMPETEIILVESVDPDAPFGGAKECGEGSVGPVAPAIANAVYDAVGVRLKGLPITPEKVLMALKKKDDIRKTGMGKEGILSRTNKHQKKGRAIM